MLEIYKFIFIFKGVSLKQGCILKSEFRFGKAVWNVAVDHGRDAEWDKLSPFPQQASTPVKESLTRAAIGNHRVKSSVSSFT